MINLHSFDIASYQMIKIPKFSIDK